MGTTIALTPTSPPPAGLTSGEHTSLVTAYDLYERMLSFTGANPGPHADRDVKNAILEALREWAGLHMWSYYLGVFRLFLDAPQTTGTITYDHTGGAYERLVTLDGATWPDWVMSGRLRVGDREASVARRISDTLLQLDSIYHLGEDQAAGTAYTLARDTYTLPEDFQSADRPLPESSVGGMTYMRPHEWLASNRYAQLLGTPRFYTFMGDPIVKGRLCIRVSPAPDTFASFDMLYKRSVRPIRTWDLTGTADVDSSLLDTLTFTGSALKAAHVGATIRVSSDSVNYPTGPDGPYPFQEERTILQVLSATSVVVDVPFVDSYAGNFCRISDPVDVEQTSMLNAFVASVRRRLSAHRQMDGRAALEKDWSFLLDLAKEGDSRDMSRRASSLCAAYRQRLADMPRGSDIS